MRIRGRHYRTGEQTELTCADGKVTSVGAPTLEPIDAEAEWLAQGFFDLQVDGFRDLKFDTATNGTIVGAIVEHCLARGITALLATLHGPLHVIRPTVKRLTAIIDSDPRLSARIVGYHLTGLFGDSGEPSRSPTWADFRRLQDAAKNRIRLVTIPLASRSLKLVEKLVANGIAVATHCLEASVDVRVTERIAAGTSVADAIDIASILPYEILGLPAPAIEVGVPVNIVLFNLVDKQFQLKSVFVE